MNQSGSKHLYLQYLDHIWVDSADFVIIICLLTLAHVTQSREDPGDQELSGREWTKTQCFSTPPLLASVVVAISSQAEVNGHAFLPKSYLRS